MLLQLTALTAFSGMAVSLWLSSYLLARGFPSPVTLRAVLVMVALSFYFLSAYLNLLQPNSASALVRAVLLTFSLVVWHDLTARLRPGAADLARRRVWVMYALGAAAVVLISLTPGFFAGSQGNGLSTARVAFNPAYLLYGVFQVLAMGAIFYNFYVLRPAGAPHTSFFFFATCAAGSNVAAYVLFVGSGIPPVPRIFQDLSLLLAVAFFGYAVARHQALVERRTTLQDFPVAAITVLGLTCLYTLLALQRGFKPAEVAAITVLAILTHSGVDLMREFLDRLLHRDESAARQHLRLLARNVGGESTLHYNLRRALAILCNRLKASGGFVALRMDDGYEVVATHASRPVGSRVDQADCDELFQPGPALAAEVAWLAPALVAGEQVAVIALGHSRGARGSYSESDLDALAEVADWVALLVATHQRQQATREQLVTLAREAEAREVGLQAGAEDLATTLDREPPPEFVSQVEDGLRLLADYTALGQSPLAAGLHAGGSTHVARGKAVRQQLLDAVEALRPPGDRPREPLPREWYSFVVLHDAYVDDVPNREIMARLYISHGTFNRVRRKALRSVARSLLETKAASQAASS